MVVLPRPVSTASLLNLLTVTRSSHPSSCATPTCDTVGLVVTALQLGQFLPQHWEMAVDKSVVGVSPWLLFFSSLYTYLAALDIVMLSGPQALSCTQGTYRCFINAQPLLQMIGSAVLSIGMWYWYLKFHHESQDVVDPEERKLLGSFFYTSMSATSFFNLFLAISTVFSLFAFACLVSCGANSPIADNFAYFCGFLAAFLNAVMWIPQILVTYTYGHKGALALGWVMASVVMDVAYSVYLAFMGLHWSVWANNVPDGVQTSILLVMLLRFEYRDRQRGVDEYGHILPYTDRERESAVLVGLVKEENVNKPITV